MSTLQSPHPQLYLECTRTLASPLHTGIERVVRNIIHHAGVVGDSLGVRCQPVVFQSRHGFVPIAVDSLNSQQAKPHQSVSGRLRTQLSAWGLLDVARRLQTKLSGPYHGFLSKIRPYSSQRIQFHPGDLLLLLDSSWQVPYWGEVQFAQSQGALAGAIVYDLLPLQFPDYCTAPQISFFEQWWHAAYPRLDFFAGISQSVCREITQYDADKKARTNPLATGSFRLGADFSKPLGKPIIRKELKALKPKGAHPFFLSVGTLSPRKNQMLILEAFDRLWSGGFPGLLVLAGGSGWHSEALIERLQSHPQRNSRLFWFEDLSDEELNWCYRHASGLITASFGEGFNLPIVEALHQRCPVIASDLPVHREVGGPYASYFPVGKVVKLQKLIEASVTHRDCTHEGHLHEFVWPSWNESCREFLQLVLSLAEQTRMVDNSRYSQAS